MFFITLKRWLDIIILRKNRIFIKSSSRMNILIIINIKFLNSFFCSW